MTVVEFKVMCQGLPLLEGDEGQQHVAGERQIECRVGFAMPVAIFLPRAGIAFVVIAVFHRPVFPNGPGRTGFFFRLEAGEEETRMAFRRGERILFLRPVAPDREG